MQRQPIQPPLDGRLAGRTAATTADRGGAAGAGSRCEGLAIRRAPADGGTGGGTSRCRRAGRAAAGGDRLCNRTCSLWQGEHLIGRFSLRDRFCANGIAGRQGIDRSHGHEGRLVHQQWVDGSRCPGRGDRLAAGSLVSRADLHGNRLIASRIVLRLLSHGQHQRAEPRGRLLLQGKNRQQDAEEQVPCQTQVA